MDAPEAGKLNLRGGVSGALQPADEGKSYKLQVAQIYNSESTVHLALVAGGDAPKHEADRIFRRSEGDLLEHPADRFLLNGHNSS